MKLLARIPAREIDGADRVLDGLVAETASGNQCRIWPAMTYDADAKQMRIAFFIEWRGMATPNDTAEVMAFTNSLMGKPPAVITETTSDPCANNENVEWLRTGRLPAPKKTN